MALPQSRAFEVKSPALAFLAVVFIFFGVSDLVAVSLPEEIGRYHWGTQAPVRVGFLFLLAVYSYAFSASSPIMASRAYIPSGWGEGLKNRVLFTWAFVEMITWFWVFITLRDERRDAAAKAAQKRAAEEDML